jgi:2-polyprenyl-6-methoxyphenol hydroxylase-like FAD-dependent oxidoreductase
MTLASVPEYDQDRVQQIGNSAVVVGASMAGLLAARVLADGYDTVNVFERDPLPEEPVARRGIPQGRHIHALLEAGRATLEDFFPGYCDELLSSGAVLNDIMSDFIVYDNGGLLADGTEPLETLFATRPLIEQTVRDRVTELDGVTIHAEHPFVDYCVSDETAAVEGIEVRDGDGNLLEYSADLVVDATGRSSKTPAWLRRNGYSTPPVDEVEVDLAYSTAVIERPIDDNRGFFVAPDAPRSRGAGVFPAEQGKWLVSLFGMHGDHPLATPEELRKFAASLPGLDVGELLEVQPWLSEEVAHYPFPSNRRIRYETLEQFPEGLVVTGDAIASFNPIYGQGMSVAALEALQLHHTLVEDGTEAIGPRFFDRIESTVEVAWNLAVGSDFAFDQTTGPKPRGTDILNRYVDRLTRKAHTDSVLRDALYRVFVMERQPESLFSPGVLWRVLRPAIVDSHRRNRDPTPPDVMSLVDDFDRGSSSP